MVALTFSFKRKKKKRFLVDAFLMALQHVSSFFLPLMLIDLLFQKEAAKPENKNVVFLKVDVDDCEVSVFSVLGYHFTKSRGNVNCS